MTRPAGDEPVALVCPAGFPVPAGTERWELIPGPAGPRGAKGDRGEPGLPVVVRRAIVYLFVVALILSGASLYGWAHEVHASHAAQQREQAAQARQGQMIEQKLCITFRSLAALKPPAGNPAANPSRQYEDQLHMTLDQLGTDLGCR